MKYANETFFKELFYKIDIFKLNAFLKNIDSKYAGEKISVKHISYFEKICGYLVEESTSQFSSGEISENLEDVLISNLDEEIKTSM